MAEVLVEHVDWRKGEIKNTALRIVGFYTHGLAQLGTHRWIDFATRIIPVVMGDLSPCDVELRGDAFKLVFHPPRPTLIPHIKQGAVVWEEREPRLTFLDSTLMNLAPSYRDLIYAVNRAIAEEATETYKIDILNNPFAFVFPKTEYGRVDINRAVMMRCLH